MESLLSDMHIILTMVSAIISKLHKACDLCGIPATVLRKCAPAPGLVLSKLYNKCFAASCFSSCWKSFSELPVFKNFGEPSEPLNYSPINLFGNVLEVLINTKLVKHLTSHSPLLNQQYGFHFSSFTAYVLMTITDFVYQALYKNHEAWALVRVISGIQQGLAC